MVRVSVAAIPCEKSKIDTNVDKENKLTQIYSSNTCSCTDYCLASYSLTTSKIVCGKSKESDGKVRAS